MRGLTIIAGVILSAAAGTSTAPPDVHKFPECDGPTTDSITIQNFPGNGSYQDIVSMEDKNRCPKQDKPYVGGVSPLDEEVGQLSGRGYLHYTNCVDASIAFCYISRTNQSQAICCL